MRVIKKYFEVKNDQYGIFRDFEKIIRYQSNESFSKILEFSANTAIFINSNFYAGENIIIAIDNINCKSSNFTSSHIYVIKDADYSNCTLNGEIHKEESLQNMNSLFILTNAEERFNESQQTSDFNEYKIEPGTECSDYLIGYNNTEKFQECFDKYT